MMTDDSRPNCPLMTYEHKAALQQLAQLILYGESKIPAI